MRILWKNKVLRCCLLGAAFGDALCYRALSLSLMAIGVGRGRQGRLRRVGYCGPAG
jgi:hypothetical protein